MTDSTLPPPEELARAQELLPWYANQSLNAEDSAWLTAWLDQYQKQVPELMAELAWIRLTTQQVRGSIPLPEPTHGLETLLSRIQQEQPNQLSAGTSAVKPHQHAAETITSWWQQRWDEIQNLFSRPALGMAFALLVVVQMGIIGNLALTKNANPYEQLTPLSGENNTKSGTKLLQVTFKENATESDMRTILHTIDGTIVAGPSALGIYTISVPQEKLETAMKTLQEDQQKQHTIDSVQKIS